MPWIIVFKSCTKWVGTEVEGGDLGQSYETREEAEKAMEIWQRDPKNKQEVYNNAAEEQGVEGWLEVKEENDGE